MVCARVMHAELKQSFTTSDLTHIKFVRPAGLSLYPEVGGSLLVDIFCQNNWRALLAVQGAAGFFDYSILIPSVTEVLLSLSPFFSTA